MAIYSDPTREVIYNILEILPTIEEALNHMIIQLDELRLEDAGVLLKDAVNGILSIARQLPQLLLNSYGDGLRLSTSTLRQAISRMIDLYEMSDLVALQSALVEYLLPAYKEWQQKLWQVLRPAVIV